MVDNRVVENMREELDSVLVLDALPNIRAVTFFYASDCTSVSVGFVSQQQQQQQRRFGPLSGQIISIVKMGCRASMLCCPVRLVEAFYRCRYTDDVKNGYHVAFVIFQ